MHVVQTFEKYMNQFSVYQIGAQFTLCTILSRIAFGPLQRLKGTQYRTDRNDTFQAINIAKSQYMIFLNRAETIVSKAEKVFVL